MKKVVIIGSGGAGKSTLARKLGEKLQLDVHHMDRLFWKPGWVLATRDEQIALQKELTENEAWVFDGNYSGTLQIRLQAADTIIFLDFPRLLCLYRVLKRRWMYHNKTRPDMAEDCPEKLDLQFLKWVWSYPSAKKPGIMEELKKLPSDKKVYILKSPKEVEQFLHTI
ncbi:DNA topology modulation protein [Bacillus timonensis]|nr:DNA topology modulation protein [Bacillus timonensis]